MHSGTADAEGLVHFGAITPINPKRMHNMTIRKHVKLGLSALALSMSLNAMAAEDPIKVGILHSLSGTMAISETVLKDTVEMLIAKQNAEGGVLGRDCLLYTSDAADE